MASPFPDLGAARQAFEQLFTDTCLIQRDEQGTADDVLDEETGDLIPPDPDANRVYRGVCMIVPEGRGRSVVVGGQTLLLATYRWFGPWDSPEVRLDDTVKITASARDPQLKNRTFRVLQVKRSSFLVARELLVEDVDGRVGIHPPV